MRIESTGSLRMLRAQRTRAATSALSTLRHNLTAEDRPEWRSPEGLPSWWPFWSDVLKDNVRDCVRAARALAVAEGREL